MDICPECYVTNARATPLLHRQDCLEKHIQYICGTCGRVICFNKDPKRHLQRWNFPFNSLNIAKLYLRTADFENQTNCGIYEISHVTCRKSYKIFKDQVAFLSYMKTNKKYTSITMKPIFQQPSFNIFPHTQIRKLTINEVTQYVKEQSNTHKYI